MDAVRETVELVRSRRPPRGMDTRIVAVDGCGGAGKSTFASMVSAELGEAPVVPTDDFASWDDPLGWWPRLLTEVLEPLGRGEPAVYRPRDWVRGGFGAPRDVRSGGYLVLEGVSSSRRAFRPFLTAAVWIAAPREERLRRGLARDGTAARERWSRWMAAEDAWVADERPEEHADLVVDGTAPSS